MRVAIIGAGPTGLVTGIGLARRGHTVTVVDRDPGPAADGSWPRRGVMQFHHAHAFRGQVHEVLEHEAPEALDTWVAAGAEPVPLTLPDGREVVMAVLSRRQTFETALRASAQAQEGLTVHRGHVDSVTSEKGRAGGVVVDGAELSAELVVDASGRSSRVTRHLPRTPSLGGPCGIAYVDRVYQLRPGAEPGPMSSPIAWRADFDGYQVIIFLHERGYFSVLLIRNTDDAGLNALRADAAFEAACRAIPGLADWVDPERSLPATGVLPGGMLLNHYRGQRGPDGRLVLPGLVSVGDAVCTTTPNFGRGVTTSLMQARELLRLLDEHGTDVAAATEDFDGWCEVNMRPWVEDHIHIDEQQRRRWAGEDVDTTSRLPSDLVLAAAEVDEEIADGTFLYTSMLGGPATLEAVEPRARALFADGWRPTPAPGPDRQELVEILRSASAG